MSRSANACLSFLYLSLTLLAALITSHKDAELSSHRGAEHTENACSALQSAANNGIATWDGLVATMARICMEDRMAHARLVKSAVGAVALLVLTVATIAAQNGSVPNPYREDTNWAKLPAGAKWGGVISVDSAANGDTWVFHR